MLAIADLAGKDWAEKARLAAGELEGASDTSSIGVRLLTDIKRIFDEDGRDCILSALLVEKLKEDPEGPWAEWGRGKGLTQNSLAVLLGGGGGRGRGGFGHPFARGSSVQRGARQGLQAEPVRRRMGALLARPKSPLPPRGGSIDRANVQTRMDKGQLAQNRPCGPCTFARSILWHLSYSRRGLHVCTVY